MNKNVKKIIAFALALNAITTISPITSNTFFVGTRSAYAASYSPDDGQLKSLKIKSLDGQSLDLRDGFNGSTVKLSDDTEYYTKLTDDSDGLKIDANVEGDDYIVKIFKSDKADATAYDPGDKILLGKGDTTLYIRTYESKSAFRKAKDVQDDVSICEEEYEINVRKTTESSYEDTTQDSIYLDSIEFSRGDLDFIKEKTTYDMEVDKDISSIRVRAVPEDSGDRVRINGYQVGLSDDYKKTISLDEGKNEIKVKVTDSKDNQRTYTINVTRGDSSDSQDDVYLDDLTLSTGNIDFSKDETEYTVDLSEDEDEIAIGATPEDEDYAVTIDGDEVTSDDDYQKDVSLDKGENKIKVTVEDELNDKKRTYTLTINRGEAQSDEDKDNTDDTTDKKSEWVQTEEGWKYYDENGKVLKKSWLYDKDQKVYCYLDENGLRVTGWFKDNDKWYLMSDKGAMLTGWQYTAGKWYLLGTDGAMKTGWYKEETDNSQSNSDAASTTGAETSSSSDSSGTKDTSLADKNTAATTSAKTENWYYLNADGTMLTGWLKDGERWYYFKSNGTMQTGWLIYQNSKYYFDETGVMITGIKTIDGKSYKFTDKGVLVI